MPRLFYGNFDFEETLARTAGPAVRPRASQRSASRRRLLTELAIVWMAIAKEGDLIWSPEPIGSAEFAQLAANGLPRIRGVFAAGDIPGNCDFVPWGWTHEALEFAKGIGARFDAPPLDAVRQVNSRAFSHALEQEVEACSPAVEEVSTETALLRAVASFADVAGGWVVKAEFGNSSRERYRHPGGLIDEEQLRAWAAKRLSAGQRLYVEPWLDRISEVGLQWTIPRIGTAQLVGVTGLMVDAAGRFQGCDFTPGWEDDVLWQPAIEAAGEAAWRAQSAGYFGPLGVDAMCYRDTGGDVRVRAIQDVNARWTMGRLALGFRRWLNSGERGRWHQSDQADASGSSPGSRTIPTSPESINGRPTQIRYAVVIEKTS